VAGRAVVLLDDVASTGRTLIEAARGAFSEGAASVDITTNWGMRSFLCTGTAWIRLGSS
jgi:ribose-phosphate pyrophosphokinase